MHVGEEAGWVVLDLRESEARAGVGTVHDKTGGEWA